VTALDAIALVLPLATGVALSPFPVVAAVLILSGARARTAGPAFAAGFLAGLAALTGLALALLDGAGGARGPVASLLRLGVGAGLILAAGMKARARLNGDPAPVPEWMAALGAAGPKRALAVGAALGGVNPKNVAFAAGAAGSIAATGADARDAAVAAGVFVALGSASVLGATAIRLLGGERTLRPLLALRTFLVDNGPVILAVVFLVLGVKLVGEGLAGFFA
jgi:threonine/homoserine/homoserine lactone efflux protein